MGLIDRVVRALRSSRSGRGESGAGSSKESYACGACRTRFDVQHVECPECGSPVVVPTDDGDGTGDRLPW